MTNIDLAFDECERLFYLILLFSGLVSLLVQSGVEVLQPPLHPSLGGHDGGLLPAHIPHTTHEHIHNPMHYKHQ